MVLVYFFGFFYLFFGLLWSVLSFFYISPFVLLFDLGSILGFDFFSIWLFFDYYCLVYLFVLSYIVSSVHFFIWVYMSEEVNLVRFVIVLNSFVLSMVVLIISPSFFSFILGWDGLGFSSFILVSWYGCDVSRYASIKTFLTNRLGDGFLLVSLCFFVYQGHFGFLFFDYLFNGLLILLFIVSFTKSAHFPFSNWLPDAMAAPTPVSALVHSSTLVTAGLFLIFRFSYLYSPCLLHFVHNFGLWTLFLGSFGACFDYNSKKIVAYSTISQLGLMSFTLSLGLYSLCFFYIMAHALFKALLFISIGGVITVNSHFQDIRFLGGVWLSNPLVVFNVFFSLFSLMGFPFLSGFYLKELILGGVLVQNLNFFSSLLFFFSILLTVYYSFRLFWVLCAGSYFLKLSIGSFVSTLCFIILYLCVVQFGVLFYSSFFLWLNLGSSWLVLLSSLLGIVLFFYCLYGLYLSNFVVFISYFYNMFYLTILNFGLNWFCSVGDFLFCFFDKGFYPFSFINHFDSFFKLFWNKILINFFFSNWLYFFGLSLGFIICVFLF
uniref:NADH dehydrogenase subunit 5 n=1 Tax=Arthurdendyus triangulatus TaxID=132421 RepID=UPI002E7A9A41|nr:NADH dehydrogenase subunit 5 [Arthurdendyus triangulatus]WPY71414.1 NADH dehydrogenase subunit 5 [Arthurdendyus triangulatus]